MRLVLLYTGKDPNPGLRGKILTLVPSAEVLDETSRLLLVEVPEEAEATLKENLPDCIVGRERTYSLPPPTSPVQ